MKLIVGLGNIGSKYAATRHNLGMMVVDLLAERWKTAFELKKKLHSSVGKYSDGDHVGLLAKPQTMMNLSGRAVAALIHFYRIDPANLIVIHDDFDLKFGQLRVKRGGGSGGHKGVESIIDAVGPEFWRMRVGVANSSLRQLVDPEQFVLQPFDRHERPILPAFINQVATLAANIALGPSIEPTSIDLSQNFEED